MSGVTFSIYEFEEGHDHQIHLAIQNDGGLPIINCAAQITVISGDDGEKLADVTQEFLREGKCELVWVDGNPSCSVFIRPGDSRVVEVARLEPSGTIKFRSKDSFKSAHMIKQEAIYVQIDVDVDYVDGTHLVEVLQGSIVVEEDKDRRRLVWYSGSAQELALP